MLKMIMIVFNEAIEPEIKDILGKFKLKNFTKITEVYGRGNTSGGHEGNDVWPGRNTIYYVACEEDAAREILNSVRSLRKTLGKEGVKAFLLPLEGMTL